MTNKLQIAIMGVVLCLGRVSHAETSMLSSDQNCLANAIYREAGGEKLIGQYAVGEIIMNRVRVGMAPSACSVVKQRNGKHWQFGFNVTGKKDIPASRQGYFNDVALKILTGTDNFSFPNNVLYFNNTPFKSKAYHLYCVIGKQRFYYKNDMSDFSRLLSVPLRGSHEVLLHQNEMAKEEGLEQIKDDTELQQLVNAGKLVPIPTSQYLAVDKRLPSNRRYCRPWVADFLSDVSESYFNRFDRPLIVDSAVRTVKVQKHLLRINRNAAAISGDAASPHLVGIAVDINKRNFSKEELAWMRNYLMMVGLTGTIDVEEEFHQKCFHLSIYDQYGMLEVPNAFK